MALAIAGLTVLGIVIGYTYSSTTSFKDGLYAAANARVTERLEATRSARWDATSYQGVDQLVASNFPDEVVTLDKSESGPGTVMATLKTTISQISVTPPVRRIRVDCIWQFKGIDLVTNSIETCRAPD